LGLEQRDIILLSVFSTTDLPLWSADWGPPGTTLLQIAASWRQRQRLQTAVRRTTRESDRRRPCRTVVSLDAAPATPPPPPTTIPRLHTRFQQNIAYPSQTRRFIDVTVLCI